jgi:hypothetical protein
MTSSQLSDLLKQQEGPNLEFKRQYKLSETPPDVSDKQSWNKLVNGQWDEFIKDVLSLANANAGACHVAGHLIVGVDDQPSSDGTRTLFDASSLSISSGQVLDRVRGASHPSLQNVECEHVPVGSKFLFVATIPPSPFVYETTRQLWPAAGCFDNSGALKYVKEAAPYTKHTVFIRQGDSIYPANQAERNALAQEKAGGDSTRKLLIAIISNTYRRAFSRRFDMRLRDAQDFVRVVHSIQECHRFLQQTFVEVLARCTKDCGSLVHAMLMQVAYMEGFLRFMAKWYGNADGFYEEVGARIEEVERIRRDFINNRRKLAAKLELELPDVPDHFFEASADETAEEGSEQESEPPRQIAGLAGLDDPTAARQEMMTLARMYELRTAGLLPGDADLRTLDALVSQMRVLAPACQLFLHEFTSSRSEGKRLAAVAVLQVKPNAAYYEWLARRLKKEVPFTVYHAAVALLAAARQADQSQRRLLKWLEHTIRATHEAVPDGSARKDVLGQFLDELNKSG